MQTAGDRSRTPLTILLLAFLLAGFHTLSRSGPEEEKEGTAGKETQTRPAQTPPAEVKKKQPGGQGAEEKPLSFTDEDLKKYHSTPGRPSTRPAATPPAQEDPLKAFQDRQERSRWRGEKVALLQQRVLDLEGRLKVLEQKRLSIANPYLPRPQGEEKGEETGLSGPERIEKTDAEIKKTSEDLESARKELATFLEAFPE